MRHTADYQGWSNWDTWHTKLMMDNDQDLYNKSREIVDHGLDSGWSDEEIIKRLQEWATRKIIAPHNRDAIKDAQEWNDIPQEERIDPHYEDLKNKNPQAADLVDSLGFGANVEDTEPTLMRDDLINWEEILQSFKSEREENEEYARQEERKKELTPYDIVHWNDERTQMMDAWLSHHGVDPHARSYGPDEERSRGVWGHQQWVPFDLIKQNVTEYGWPHGFGDSTAKQIEQEGGWNYSTRDLGEQAAVALQRGQAVPWQQEMMEHALKAKGYTTPEAQQIMRQRYKLVPNPKYPDQNMLVDMEKPPKQPDPSLDQPGELTLPDHWGSTDEWDEMWDRDPFASDYYDERTPFLVEFAESADDPDPLVWIGDKGGNHLDRGLGWGLQNPHHRYYGEIWTDTNPPRFVGSPGDPAFDQQAIAHAQNAYYSQQEMQKRASDGADYWTQSQDDWWSTQGDSLYNVDVPGEAPGMPRDLITDSLHCPQCNGPMHGLECPQCGFKKEAADMQISDQTHIMDPEDHGSGWDDAQWDSDTFLDHDMINEHLKTVAQGQQYMDYAKREKRRQEAEWPQLGMKEAGWYDEVGGPCPRCGRGELVHGSDLKGQQQEWCRHCGWTDRDEIKPQAVPKPGDYAKSRDGHPVQIVGLHTEGENLFATIRYLDGYMPYPSVGGRAGGTEEDPLWEHGVYDRKVVRPGGDYYNDKHWMIEPGLQLQQQETLPGLNTPKMAADNVPGTPVSDSGHWVWLDGHVGMGGTHSDIAESLARDLGYDDTQTNYLSNWIARGHCPEDMAVAVGTLKNNYPYIWNSTRDRNHVWDAVKEHVDGPAEPSVPRL